MQWTSTLAIALVPAFLGAACSHHESHAAPPKTASKLPPQDHPMPPSANPATPPAPDANAATRKPAEPMSKAPPPEIPPAPQIPSAEVSRDAQAGSGDERLLSDEEAAIPTQEEANLEAEQAINDENADQEFDKLEKELEGGGG
jgi:hypothetical protein